MRVVAILWLVLVTAVLCLPGSSLPGNPFLAMIHADKLVHIFLFATGTFLFLRPLLQPGLPGRVQFKRCILVVLPAIAYGVGMEYVQKYWVVSRSFEAGDIVADSAGSFIGLFCALFWLERARKKIGPDRNRDRNQN